MTNKRTYKENNGRRCGMVVRMNPIAEGVTHVFVEHNETRTRYMGPVIDDFIVEGGFFEAMRHICREYGRSFVRCDDKLFGLD